MLLFPSQKNDWFTRKTKERIPNPGNFWLCCGHDTNESDSAVCMTLKSQTLLCAWHRIVKLCCVHDTDLSDSAVCMTPKSQTLLCAWHHRGKLLPQSQVNQFVKELRSRHYTRAQQARNQNLKLAGLWLLWNRQLGKVFFWVNTPII